MTDPPPTIARTVRRAVDLDVDTPADRRPAPADRHRPAPAYSPRSAQRSAGIPSPRDVVDQVAADRTAGKPRSKPRPMPEYPREGYGAYQLFGDPPPADVWWRRWVDWLIGQLEDYLYAGITCRAGFIRWVEHSDTRSWAGDVTSAQIIRGEWWQTLNDTVVDERTGLPWLVYDVESTADEGIRPIRPGELVHTDPAPGVKHGERVEVFTLDPAAGVELPGLIVEGARSGEKRIIQGWDGGRRPIHNIEHNEGDHAVNRVRRRFPRLVAIARRRALLLAAGWGLLGGLLAWWLTGPLPVGSATATGIAAAAVVLQGAQLVRLAGAGAPVSPRRRRPRKPAGSKRRQRARRRRRR